MLLRKICVALCLCFLAGCGVDTANPSAETAPLELGVMPSLDYLPLAIAQREGYFKEAGLKITLHPFYSANDRDAALQSGNIDGTVIDYAGALLQLAGGVDLRLTSRCDASFYLVAGKQSGIKNLEDMQGKSVAVSRNTVIDYFVDMALHSVDLTESDVTKMEVNKIPVRFELLQNGKVDVAGLPNPLAMIAEEAGGVVLTTNNSLGFSINGIVFTAKARQEKAEQIRKLYRVYNRGVAYLKEHSVADIQDILVDTFGFPPALVEKTSFVYTQAALPDKKSLLLVMEWLMQRNLIPADFDASAVLDGSFLPGSVEGS